jgi:hypothetical protein
LDKNKEKDSINPIGAELRSQLPKWRGVAKATMTSLKHQGPSTKIQME